MKTAIIFWEKSIMILSASTKMKDPALIRERDFMELLAGLEPATC